MEGVARFAMPNGEEPIAQQSHERSVVRQNADLSVERRRNHRIGGPLK